MFRSELVLKADKQPGVWTVAEPLLWSVGPRQCDAIMVPAGTLTDLASVPQILHNVPFLDPVGRSRRPAVLHDFLYRGGSFVCGRRPVRVEADGILHRALIAEGCSRWVASIFWLGVRLGGWAAWVKRRRH